MEKTLNKFDLGKGDFADIRVYEGYGTLIAIQNNRPDKIHHGKEIGVGIRALIDGGWGFVSIAGKEPKRIEEALDRAIRIATITSERIKEKGKMPEDYAVEGKHKVKYKIDPRNIPLDAKYNIVKEFERVTREYSERIVSTHASLKQWFQREMIVNSLGTKVETEYGNLNISCMATSREGETMQNVYTAKGTTNGWEELKKYHVTEQGTKLAERAVKLLHARKPPSGRMNIIMDQSLVGVFVHETFNRV